MMMQGREALARYKAHFKFLSSILAADFGEPCYVKEIRNSLFKMDKCLAHIMRRLALDGFSFHEIYLVERQKYPEPYHLAYEQRKQIRKYLKSKLESDTCLTPDFIKTGEEIIKLGYKQWGGND